jgi:pimeloyl-ACP methyl ester carboxylesterase
MSTFVLLHAAGDGGWVWRMVEAELRERGHDVVAPDLPSSGPGGLTEYAASVSASGDDLIVVGHSVSGFTAPLVASRLSARLLVMVAAMIPAPGETPSTWWDNVGYQSAGYEDPYYHDVPVELAEEAQRRERGVPDGLMESVWPLPAWPDIPTKFVLCTEDRCFTPEFLRPLVTKRLGIVPDEIAAGHCVMLSQPVRLASLLAGYASDGVGQGAGDR